MTTEEKAKAYDRALEIANAAHRDDDTHLKTTLERIFPELKENEERIRKLILESIKNLQIIATTKDRELAIAWLEKQKVTDEEIIFRPVVGTDIRIAAKQALEKINIGKKVVLAFNGAYIPVNGKTVGEIDSEYDAWLEKQGESTLIEEIKRRKELFSQEKEKAVSSSEKLSLGGRIAMLEELLVFVNEKQDEQKPILDFKASNWYVSKVDGKIHDLTYNPADKVKPKFKVGDWILYSGDHYEGVRHITKIDENGYYIERNGLPHGIIPFNHDICMRLWTIQDAKGGDVLVNGSNIFIFHFINETRLMGYCHVNTDDGRFYDDIGKNECFCLIDAIVNPATKEQRDTLFKAMANAGYTFNFDKKELKKIEQKPSWSEEDEKMLDFCIKHYADCNCITWLESLKTRLKGM